MRRLLATALLCVGAALPVHAQDTSGVRGVRLGITYSPGVRPSLVVLPASGLDSVRAILSRDLDYSDRFEVVVLPPGEVSRVGKGNAINYKLYRTLGAQYGVEVVPAPVGVTVRLHDLDAGAVRVEQAVALSAVGSPDFRMQVHQLADQVVRWITGVPGIAASRLLYVVEGRVWRVDSDGYDPGIVTGGAGQALSPAWEPGGRRFAYTRFEDGRGSIVLQDILGGGSSVLPGTTRELNITPAFSPDGHWLAWARVGEDGTDIYKENVAPGGGPQRLTAGRFADNLSPTYSPDGRRIAFVSTRAGLPQIYVMGADGTDQELLAPFDYGVTGSSNAPEWSPDGASVVFHREVDGTPQIFVLDVGSHRVRQLTSSGRNTDPTWAPDGRHVAYVSDRSGRRQLWVIDIETGRIRQIQTAGSVRLPAWSPRLGGTAALTNP